MFSVGCVKENQKCYTMHMISKSLHCRVEINFACIFVENLFTLSFCRWDASHHDRNLSSGKAMSWVKCQKYGYYLYFLEILLLLRSRNGSYCTMNPAVSLSRKTHKTVNWAALPSGVTEFFFLYIYRIIIKSYLAVMIF